MMEFLKKKLYESIENHYVLIKPEKSSLLFHAKNIGFLGEKYLIIKHRKTGKRISKKIKNKKVEFFSYEIANMNESGIFDVYMKVILFNSQYLKRTAAIQENTNIKLIDEKKKMGFLSYATRSIQLSFLVSKSFLNQEITNIDYTENSLYVEGNLIPYEDSKFDEVELCLENLKNLKKKCFKCDYIKNSTTHFNTKISFKEDEEKIINSSWKFKIKLKNNGVSNIYNTISSKYLQNKGGFEFFLKENLLISLNGEDSVKNAKNIYDYGNKLILQIKTNDID